MTGETKTFSARAHEAIRANDIAAVKALFTQDPSRLHEVGPFGTWLHYAARVSSVEIVAFFVREGMNINVTHPRDGGTPLLEAASVGNEDVAKYLLERALMSMSVRPRIMSYSAQFSDDL
jgi:ankyrin repeat protein